MAASSVIKNQFGAGSITIKDGTGSPLTVAADFDQGDFSVSGLMANLKESAVYQTRGVVRSVRHTERSFPSISFTALMSEFSDASGGTMLNMIAGTAPFAARVSTLGASADVITFDVVIVIEGTDLGDSADATLTFEDVALAVDYTGGDPSQFSVSGTVYGGITGDLTIS